MHKLRVHFGNKFNTLKLYTYASKNMKFTQQNSQTQNLQGEYACSHSKFSGEVASDNRAIVY